jgi:hypothetical protein
LAQRAADELDHRAFGDARTLVEERGEAYLERAIQALVAAVDELYGGQAISLQRLSATFRRSDLLSFF